VLTHAGTTADGRLATAVIAAGGVALHLLPAAEPLQTHVAVLDTPPPAPAIAAATAPQSPPQSIPQPALNTAPPAAALQPERPYSALRSVYPRSWLPAITADGGLSAYGASTSGGDALGWHRYALLAQVETSQKELVGAFEYQFAGSHGIALTRELTPQLWRTQGNEDTPLVYDRRSQVQWLSLFPYTRVQHRAVLGLGAAADVIDRVDLRDGSATRRRDSRLLAALLELDSSGGDWASEGANRGLRGSLLVESHKPLAGGNTHRLDGTVVRADLRAYLALPLKSVLALRGTEARARGRTQPFALGDATDEWLQLGPVLGDRTLALRGYRAGDEAALVGQNARVVSAEWRVPLADVDRHFMVPAVGLNRVSGALFVEAGGAWNSGDGPQAWRRSVGVELLAEARLLYALGLQLRLGVARALDGDEGTRGYLTVGRAF
jgi:hypothetical protein